MRLHDCGETLFHPGAMSGGIAINSWINRGERIYIRYISVSHRDVAPRSFPDRNAASPLLAPSHRSFASLMSLLILDSCDVSQMSAATNIFPLLRFFHFFFLFHDRTFLVNLFRYISSSVFLLFLFSFFSR